jgi:hypothetical protein
MSAHFVASKNHDRTKTGQFCSQRKKHINVWPLSAISESTSCAAEKDKG